MNSPRSRRICRILLQLIVGVSSLSAFQAPARAQDSATCMLPVSPPPSRSRVVFVLDTSGSMAGLGDGQANIFGKVQTAIVQGMRDTQAAGTVELLTFDRGPRYRSSFNWPSDKARFDTSVKSLKADGANTWLYASMESMFASLKERDDTATTVYVITDGFDNDPSHSHSIRTALDSFNLSRGPFDKLYYIALAATIPAEVKEAFQATTYAQALQLGLNQAPDFTSYRIAPGVVNVKSDGSFPYKRPAQTTLELQADQIGGVPVSIRNPVGAGEKVLLNIEGNVPAGAVGYMCAHLPTGTQNILLRFQETTPPLKQERQAPVRVLGTLKLLNPNDHYLLKKGQSAMWHYQALGGPVTVQVLDSPPELAAHLPDQTISLQQGERVDLIVTDKALQQGQRAAPRLTVNDDQVMKVPQVEGVVPKPFPWQWLLLLLVPLPFLLWWRRERRPLEPYALSVDKALRVSLHDPAGWKATRVMRQEQADIGQLFRLNKLRGLRLERFKPEIPDGEEVLLDNSNLDSIRRYTAQQVKRAVKLQAQPELLRLQKHGEATRTFLLLEETLVIDKLYLFTEIQAPPVRVRPAPLPAEPPIEVIVGFLDAGRLQELELPLEDVDLADVFQTEGLRGLVVRREPGLLRLRHLRSDMYVTHISRSFVPGDALPLAVMLELQTRLGAYQLRIRDKASMERYQR